MVPGNRWMALDVGGANLKLSDGAGHTITAAFPMWREHRQLATRLRTMLAESPPWDRLAVTMTGELADCFASRDEGVRFITAAVEDAAAGRHTRYFRADGKFVAGAVAVRSTELVAAANWRALAEFAVRYAESRPALVIDIGSTTTDLVPLFDGQVAAQGMNDTDRLLAGELVYTGVERSFLPGLLGTVPYRGRTCPVMNELFATTADVYVLLGELPENETNTATADGRPLTRSMSRRRVQRLIGAADEQFNHRDATQIAQHAREVQLELLGHSYRRVLAAMRREPELVVTAGQGEFLAKRLLAHAGFEGRRISLSTLIGGEASRAATAHALAVLAREATQR